MDWVVSLQKQSDKKNCWPLDVLITALVDKGHAGVGGVQGEGGGGNGNGKRRIIIVDRH